MEEGRVKMRGWRRGGEGENGRMREGREGRVGG